MDFYQIYVSNSMHELLLTLLFFIDINLFWTSCSDK